MVSITPGTPETQNTPTTAPNIASCLGKIVESLGFDNPNSNDICENLDAICNCVWGVARVFRFIISDFDGGVVSNASFNTIADSVEHGDIVIARYSDHAFYLSSFTNTSSSKSCVFNGIVADGSSAIVHTFNVTPDGVTHTTTRLTVQTK